MKNFKWQAVRLLCFAILTVLCVAGVAVAEEPMRLNLEQTVIKALENNPSIEAARASERASQESTKAALGGFGPKLTSTYGYTRLDHDNVVSEEDVWKGSLTVTQNLFTGFKVLSTYQRTKLQEESAGYSKLNVELSLILNVQENFINLLVARENVRSAQDSVERLASQLKITRAFYDVGLQPRIDVLRAEVNLSDAERKLVTAENSLATQQARLNTLLNLPLEANVDYEGVLNFMDFTQGLEQSLEEAARNRPDMNIARKAVKIAMEDLDITQSVFYPQVSASFTGSRQGNSPKINGSPIVDTEFANWQAGVNMSWELFSSGTTYFASQAGKQNISSLKSTEANTWQEATFEIQSRHLSITEAAKRIKVAQKTVESAKEAFRMAQARYQAQVGTNTDVLDAQADLTSAEASLTQAMGDYMIAIARVYNSTGRKNPGLSNGQ